MSVEYRLINIIEKWLASDGYDYMAIGEEISVVPLITFTTKYYLIVETMPNIFSVYYDYVVLNEFNITQKSTPIYIHDPEFFSKLESLLKSMGAKTQAWRRILSF